MSAEHPPPSPPSTPGGEAQTWPPPPKQGTGIGAIGAGPTNDVPNPRTDPKRILRRVGFVSLTGALFGLAYVRMVHEYRGESAQRLHDRILDNYGTLMLGWVLPIIVATFVALGLLGLSAVVVFHRWVRPWLRVRSPAWAESLWSDNPRPLTGLLRITSWALPAAAFVLLLTMEANWSFATFVVFFLGPLLIECWRTKPWREAV